MLVAMTSLAPDEAYIGKGRALDDAVGAFAIAYADQTERDHRQLVDALASGLLPTAAGW
jgi:Uncharacterized protein conserved in bacteria (DUF2252)